MSNHSSLRRATRRARILAGALATCLALSVSGCGGSESDSSTVRVAVTTPSWNAGFATFLLSQAEGYFEDEGIDVEFTLPPSGTQAAQQRGMPTSRWSPPSP